MTLTSLLPESRPRLAFRLRCSAGWVLGAFALAAGSTKADTPPPPLFYDKTAYPPPHLSWSVNTDEKQVIKVFPHPLQTQRVVLSTSAGLSLSEDAGNTWTVLPEASADKVGPILDVAFHPLAPDTFYIASQTKGLWITTDAGKTFAQVGSQAVGMAADSVVGVIVYSGDSSHQTLLAVHGDAAPGLSRSIDGGKTWDVINTEYHFRRLLSGQGNQQGAGNGQQLYLFGSTLKDPDIKSVYSVSSLGEFVAEAVRDVVPTDMAYALAFYRKPAAVYLTTSDSGLYRIDNGDSAGLSYNVKQIPFKDTTGWASVGTTWGASADAVNLFLYDPTKLGLVITTDDLATSRMESDGLPVSPLVKEGAVLRPNANGTVFYAVANGSLAVGRATDDVPVVSFTPSAFEVSEQDDNAMQDLSMALQDFSNFKGSTVDAVKALTQRVGDPSAFYHQHQISVTARVPVTSTRPKSVTVDLSRFGGYPNTPLFDDGQHGDGAAGDGTYGRIFAFLPTRNRPREDEWRSSWPGRVAMGVDATYADGHHQGAVGVVDVFEKVLDIAVWHDGVGSVTDDVEGGVTVEPFVNPLLPGQPGYAPKLHHGDVAARIKAPQGAWKVNFKAPYNKHDVSSHPALSFYIKLESGQAPKEIYLQLHDQPDFSPPTTTERIPVLNGMVLNGNYQRVVIPMKQVIGTALQFQTDRLDAITVSAEGSAPATLVFDGMGFTAAYPPPPDKPDPSP